MKDFIHTGLLSRNKVGVIAEEDLPQTRDYLETVRAFARLSQESIYLIDYTAMRFEYVSEHPLFLCGYTAAEVQAMGYDFYFRHLAKEDLALLHRINEAGFAFFERLPDADKKSYSIGYDFHLVHRDGQSILVHHKLTPLFLTQEGKMWKAMCVVSTSCRQEAGNIVIQKDGTNEIWHFDLDAKVWLRTQKPELTNREREVLRLYAQGLTISQIAGGLYVAPDTVKYYRRCIFAHFEVSNIVAALARALQLKII